MDNKKLRHCEDNVYINRPSEVVFSYVDDHSKFSAHMNNSSWMMAGSKMNTEIDDGHGMRVGSHIKMDGKILGIPLFLDEVITERKTPALKTWKTVGEPKLIIIGDYEMGFKIKDEGEGSNLSVFIDYTLPHSWTTRWLGYLFSGFYARWCVRQMVNSAKNCLEKL
ncbi:SRPBCC family protein [Patescibacteria group bacterium]|nr:SRPBCC family protein [Patescibacteria group bacterium]